jgi:hypothetical protein
MPTEDQTKKQLTEAEKREAEQQRRIARTVAEEDAAVRAEQKAKDEAARVHQMGPQEFDAYKKKQFRLTEQRQREAERKALAEANA